MNWEPKEGKRFGLRTGTYTDAAGNPLPKPVAKVLSPLKWVGGKRKLAPIILDHALPPTRLVEPFAGSMSFTAAFADRHPGVPMYVSDALSALVDLYQRLADTQSEIHSMLRDLAAAYERRNKADRKKWYYELREAYTLGFDDPDTDAAVLFTMLRTCYNGMFRTNRKTGRFDTPAGFMEAKTMYDPVKVAAFGEMIRGLARLACRDYRNSIGDVAPGSLVYLDPPYKGTYDGYCGKVGFDQEGLAPFIRECMKRGARQVIMSQSYEPQYWHETLPEATQVPLERREGVNRNVAEVGRPLVRELLLIVERR
jgi:DNA adenine methylase